jgi:hypothetical protein
MADRPAAREILWVLTQSNRHRLILTRVGDVVCSATPRAGSQPGEQYAEQRTEKNVTGKMNPGVHPRVGNERRERAQRHGDLRLGGSYSSRERKARCRVPGRKRARPRHSDMAGELKPSNRPPPSAERFQRRVHDGGRNRERREAVDGGAPSLGSPGRGQDARGGEPQPGIVRGAGQPSHGAVEPGDVGARDGRVHGGVDTLGLAEPVA